MTLYCPYCHGPLGTAALAVPTKYGHAHPACVPVRDILMTQSRGWEHDRPASAGLYGRSIK